jgi:hypothetical protein
MGEKGVQFKTTLWVVLEQVGIEMNFFTFFRAYQSGHVVSSFV